MIFQILLTCSFTTLLVHGQRYSKRIQDHPIHPRAGYSSTIVHSYPENKNNLHSESSVRVNFHPQQDVAVQSSLRRGAVRHLQPSNNAALNNFFTRTSFDNKPQETNSFNVGYNISFSGLNASKNKKPVYTRANTKKLENSEVITGKLKKNEKVRAPTVNPDLSPEDFVSQAYLNQKKMIPDVLRHASSSINTRGSASSVKFLQPIREHFSNLPSQSPKFTYNTPKNGFRDAIKSTKPDPIQLGQEFKTSYQTNSLWKNVGHGLEISKSIEPQISEENYGHTQGHRYTNSKITQVGQPKNFNHDSALKNSQAFDFSNAHGEILFGDTDPLKDTFPEASEQYTQKTNNYEVSEQSTNRNNMEESYNNQFSELNNINIEAHIPSRLRGIKPLPIDTSLLRDVVLTTDFKETPKDPRVIPIRFDISNIETAMREQVAQIQSHAANHNPHYINNLQLPNPSHNNGLTYEDHDPSASQKEFRVHVQPESLDANQYRMGYNYDRQHSNFNNDVYKIVSMRPPPVGHNVKY